VPYYFQIWISYLLFSIVDYSLVIKGVNEEKEGIKKKTKKKKKIQDADEVRDIVTMETDLYL